MDGDRFDALARRFAGAGATAGGTGSRRSLLKAALGGIAAVAGAAGGAGRDGAAQSCRQVADRCTDAKPCCAGLRCVSKICVPEPGQPACVAPGNACGGASGALACCPGTRCAGGVCCPAPLACGNACCAGGTLCQRGVCQSPTGGTGCPAGQTRCGTAGCRDLATDPANCGSCGVSCPGGICAAGACATIGTGGACTAAEQCATGICVDGVCCDRACGGQCEACNLPGSAGTCSAVTGAPTGVRPACAGAGACAGTCDGANPSACAYPVGTPCGAATCSGSVATASPTCDGVGGCLAGAQTDCAPYGCADGACLTSCAGGEQCGTGLCRQDGTCCPAADACNDVTGAPSSCCAPGRAATETCCPHPGICCECFVDVRAGRTFCCEPVKVCRTGTPGDPAYDPSQDTCCRSDEICVDGYCCQKEFVCPDGAGGQICCDRPCCQGQCLPFGMECACGGTIVPSDRPCEAGCCADDICTQGTCCPTNRAILRNVDPETGAEFYQCCAYGFEASDRYGPLDCKKLPDVGGTFRVTNPRG